MNACFNTIGMTTNGACYPAKAYDLAFHFAKSFKAHLQIDFIHPDPRTSIPFMGEGFSAEMIQQFCDNLERDNIKAGKAAEKYFTALAQKITLNLEKNYQFNRLVGDLEDHVGRRGRLRDLNIVLQPHSDHPCRQIIFNDFLYKSGRPLLLLPEKAAYPEQHALITWNGRAEGARAVGASLNFLRHFKKITALQIGDLGKDRPPLNDLLVYLANAGLKAEGIVLTGSDLSPDGHLVHDATLSHGENILAVAQKINADLIIMGAYSHARWREMILGGVTHHLIHTSPIPLFMSH